ncbi:aminoglycoside phosphotransferase [Pochonia chlamydosporia 170]|uniref:Aminoglycoside phosphotransferase n=1 Tax=Pochonia chlamydosporia 170 TaxID=1380566 RepID=A0A179F401_METCM|nr:aminoglycoside phosphotransferase [Pochonia chlamydosporia 170]OAQ60154.1 aminoglycoside phosphotransferase [Pochonia chlamydosporia 170]
MSNSTTRQLLRGNVNLDDALEEDDNILTQLHYPEQKQRFWSSLTARKAEIESMLCCQLGVDWCHLCAMETWKSGSFNVVIPVLLRPRKTVFLRVPLPYKTGEGNAPGNSDEKLRTEIATYIWLEANCPDIPIPILHAFGFSDGFVARRWILKLLGRPVPSRYLRRGCRNPLETGYLVTSQAKGTMLALSWETHRHHKSYRERLFRNLANITLSINRTPLSRIGSLTMRSDGCITLSNRPLDLHFQMLENEGIASGIPRQRTYAAVEPYLSDLLSLQDSKILNQPNAIHDRQDGESQLAALTALRAIMHRFVSPEYRDGPFYLTLTDLHQSNIFVDEQWNIQTIIDLEWAHAKPIEMQVPPYWLTSRAVDGFYDADAIAEYDTILDEYLSIYAAEERRRNGVIVEAPIKRHVWKSGGFWYFHAVSIPKGMYNLFNRHIQPLFNKEHSEISIFDEVFFWYWGEDAAETISAKLKDNEDYLDRVKKAFGHS